jgi:hypothetical protein
LEIQLWAAILTTVPPLACYKTMLARDSMLTDSIKTMEVLDLSVKLCMKKLIMIYWETLTKIIDFQGNWLEPS